NIWFGTGTVLFDGGLTKFDGENWTSYALDTLVDFYIKWVKDIEIDGNNVLWATTTYGAIYIDRDTLRWLRPLHDLPVETVRYVAIDNANVKWFTSPIGLISYVDSSFSVYDTSDGLYSLICYDVSFNDTFLLLSYFHDNVLSEYNGITWQHYDSSNGITAGHLKILVDNSGTLYLGGDEEGIFRRFRSSGLLFDNIPTLDGDFPGVIWDIAVDEQNNKYFVNNFGLYVYNEDSIVWNIRESHNQVNSSGFEIYPNPFTHEVCFSSNDFLEFYIYDIQGKQIDALNGRSVKWKPNDLSSGVYFVKVNMLEKKVIKKIFYTR
ncbi:MAG: T9SS type A sorting domain-containing protein, partial [Candidatus Zixiibacteriota bacterium]